MRPVRLDIDGFASYREPATVDFTDVDYFSLIGPTGSGKSTIVDAMAFALYGTAHRWERSNAVAYALAPTGTRCTVSLIFDLDGQRYQAVREVRRTGQTIQQKNARLERFHDPTACPAPGDPAPGSDVLAAEVRDMTPAVSKLLGLDFDDFCQCVVLPQGEFAQFLKAKASDRQTILLKLLGVDQYEEIGKAAGVRASEAEKEAHLYTEQLGQYADATEEALNEATARRDRLHALTLRTPALIASIGAARAEETGHRARFAAATGAVADLLSIEIPDGVTERHSQLLTAQDAQQITQESLTEAAEDMARTLAAAAAGPQRSFVVGTEQLYEDQQLVVAELSEVAEAVSVAEANEVTASQAASRAQMVVQNARSEERTAYVADVKATEAIQRLTAQLDRMTKVIAPDHIEEIARVVQEAEARVAETETSLQRARSAAKAAADEWAQTPDIRRVAATASHIDRLIARAEEWTSLAAALEDRSRDMRNSEVGLAAATTQRDEAEARLQSERVRSGAAALRPTLRVGHACPVCTQTVGELPPAVRHVPLDAAHKALARAKEAFSTAERKHRQASQAREAANFRTAAAEQALREDLTQVRTALTEYLTEIGLELDPPLVQREDEPLTQPVVVTFAGQARTMLRQVEKRCFEATTRKNETESDQEIAEQTREDALRGLADANRHLDRIRSTLIATRTTVVDDGAPALQLADAESVEAAWSTLMAWAAERTQFLRCELLPDAQAEASAAATALTDVRRRLAAAEQSEHEAAQIARAAAQAAASAQTRHDSLTRQRQQLAMRLDGVPRREALPGLLAEADRLEAARQDAIRVADDARKRAAQASQALEEARRAVTADRDALGRARDRVAALQPPAFDGVRLDHDLARCWAELVEWAHSERTSQEEVIADARDAMAEAAATAAATIEVLRAALRNHEVPAEGVEADPRRAEILVAEAHAAADGEVRMLVRARSEADVLRKKAAAAQESAEVARDLHLLLRRDRFGRWLATAALDMLVVGASEGLKRLSDGQFSLTHDKGDFFVIDHFDADSSRPVKTLSGGETFQASLALALALSEQLAALAAGGAAKLDSIFLDEGFGTLDPDALEIVAATLETLSRGERMVGVVTHVAALAERTPVRFVVSHDNRTSRIEREAV